MSFNAYHCQIGSDSLQILNLKFLHLVDSDLTAPLQDYFATFRSLIVLEIDKITSLKNLIYPGIENLLHLKLKNGTFDDLHELSVCTSLTRLDMSNNTKFKMLQCLEQLPLTLLSLENCQELQNIDNIFNRNSQICYLDLSGCSKLYNIGRIDLLSRLRWLFLRGTAVADFIAERMSARFSHLIRSNFEVELVHPDNEDSDNQNEERA
jgi:hypothetical protein